MNNPLVALKRTLRFNTPRVRLTFDLHSFDFKSQTQVVGNFHGFKFFGRNANTGPTTSGITSPALRTTTVSPGRTSFNSTCSRLCSVAIETVLPDNTTGSSTANGVARPVRPIETEIFLRIVLRSSGANFTAIAQRGARDVKPSCSRCASSSSFTTTPSIS